MRMFTSPLLTAALFGISIPLLQQPVLLTTQTSSGVQAGAIGFPIPLPNNEISGVVRQAGSGETVPNVPVSLSMNGSQIAIAVTGQDGGFSFGGLRPGAYTVSVGGTSANVSIGSFSAFVEIVID